jgi:hypothetical protein
MKKLSGNFLSTDKGFTNIGTLFTSWVLLCHLQVAAQLANYVNNGGFEICANCEISAFKKPLYWDATDTNRFFGVLCSKKFSSPGVPLNSYTYQWPRHGDNYLGSQFFCPTCNYNTRGYPRNLLKQTLSAGHTYCFSMYVNLTNQSTHAIKEIGVFFADSTTDSINECTIPLTFLMPQITNTTNTITDTLNWVLIRGLYSAYGNEKYLMLGNFNSDANTNNILVNPANSPAIFSNYLYDDISCIDIDLPANSGPDQSIIPGDSVFIGRQQDVGIDEACMWYKLPDTTIPIDTVAGLWVNPVTTSTYIVRQEICGNVKWDTVVVYMNLTGLEKFRFIGERLTVFPVPATDHLELMVGDEISLAGFNRVVIYDHLGEMIKVEEINFKNGKAKINTSCLKDGVYSLRLISAEEGVISKRFLIKR